MNKNKFEEHVTQIMDYLDRDEPRMAFNAYKTLVDESAETGSSEPIVYRGKKGEYLLENSYLLEKLMDQSRETIRLYIDDIDESSYGHVVVRNMLFNWLKQDKQRKVKLLIRKAFGFLSSAFYYTNYEFIENRQIQVRTLKDKEKCSSYAGIFDTNAIKIKEKETDNEVMVGVFSDQASAVKMAEIFDQVFDIAIPVSNRFALFVNKFLENRNITSSQKTLIRSFTQLIQNRVNDTDRMLSSVHYNKPIPFKL